ncbi:MAG: rod shape-determining protein MreC [Prolixibacteraceae bacterium]|nr:rod shape-determining protein MreC [Prolixibacteraceae bacterium]
MRSLIRYLIKNYAFLLFLLLEIVSFILLFNFGRYQKVQYFNSANRITASVYRGFNSVVNYFELTKINRELADENALLKSQIQLKKNSEVASLSNVSRFFVGDTTYKYIPVRVINNSVNKVFNYITLDKGWKQGIKPDQGIVSPNGIVGVVISVSNSYSLGLSVLNQRWSVSVKLKKNGYFGSLSWRGNDYRIANLMEIPFHVELAHGDTVVTSGYSSIFPEGILVGTIQSFSKPQGENYYNIQVRLSTDFKALSFVDVIENMNKKEIKKLENVNQDGTTNN